MASLPAYCTHGLQAFAVCRLIHLLSAIQPIRDIEAK